MTDRERFMDELIKRLPSLGGDRARKVQATVGTLQDLAENAFAAGQAAAQVHQSNPFDEIFTSLKSKYRG